MIDDDEVAAWASARRRRKFLLNSLVLGVVAVVGAMAGVLGVRWVWGFSGACAGFAVVSLLLWRGERRAS